jgi:hypothetical protein
MRAAGTFLGVLLAALVAGGACHSQEPVVPFMDAGNPCSGAAGPHPIDCAQYAETTCVVQGSTCPAETYGCADAAYFTKDDYSMCPPEGGGGDAAQLGDVALFGDDVAEGPEGAASDASDASDD